MTPEISTRLAALSPRPENASTDGSRSLPADNSPGPSRFGPVPPGGKPPSFLDSNPSDPMTADPTPLSAARHLTRRHRNTHQSMASQHDATRISRIKRQVSRFRRIDKKQLCRNL